MWRPFGLLGPKQPGKRTSGRAIWLCSSKENAKDCVAIKEFAKPDTRALERTLDIFKALGKKEEKDSYCLRLREQTITDYLNNPAAFEDSLPYIVTDAGTASLRERIDSPFLKYPLDDSVDIATFLLCLCKLKMDILESINEYHNAGFCHHDITPAHIVYFKARGAVSSRWKLIGYDNSQPLSLEDDLRQELSSSTNMEEEPRCAICLEALKTDPKERLASCQHMFHTKCIDDWMAHESSACEQCPCPLCRKPVVRGSLRAMDKWALGLCLLEAVLGKKYFKQLRTEGWLPISGMDRGMVVRFGDGMASASRVIGNWDDPISGDSRVKIAGFICDVINMMVADDDFRIENRELEEWIGFSSGCMQSST